jgi:hypothetical protein
MPPKTQGTWDTSKFSDYIWQVEVDLDQAPSADSIGPAILFEKFQ